MLTMSELTAEQRLQKAVVDIMNCPRYIPLAGVLLIAERVVIESNITACTDGRDELYGRAFVGSLTDAELRFLILHEAYHRLYRHITTWKHLWDEDNRLANIACDLVINAKLVADNQDGFATMPKDGMHDPQYLGWDSARVFIKLKQRQDPPPRGGGEGGEGGESGEEKSEETSGAGRGSDSSDTSLEELLDKEGKLDDHDWEGGKEMSQEEQDQLERDVDQAIRQGAMAAGKMGLDIDADIADRLTPKVDWREVLREFVTSTCSGSDYSTYARPNRRYMASGIYMPSGISETVEVLVAAPDASGSCWHVLPQWVAEVKRIAEVVKPKKLIVLYWDTDVEKVETYDINDMDNPDIQTIPRGGGGTEIECVPKWLADNNIKPTACVVLTDGYLAGGWGQWTCPLLWCFVNNDKANPPTGKRVFI
jgi:predicted metal-dependent peptidase